MFATIKASRFGFFGIVVALAATLGGCAESVSGTAGASAVDYRNPFVATRITPHPFKEAEEPGLVRKVEEARTARVDAKHGAHIAADVR
jgi:hypothetical protein